MEIESLGFIGLGVMGGPMSRNLTRASKLPVAVFDPEPAAMAATVELGAVAFESVTALAGEVDAVFLSLPSIVQVEQVVGEILRAENKPRYIVDMSTSDVNRTKQLGDKAAAAGCVLVDAPVARLRQAAIDGTLLITVGASESVFAELLPLLTCMGSDVIHAGPIGSGQVVKIINNMVVFQNINALAEAMAIGRSSGVDGQTLFETLTLGSADSFQLRNAAMDTLVPDLFPEKRFPTTYAIKDMALALALAAEGGVRTPGAQQTMELLEQTRDAGYAENYYPAMIRLLDERA